MKSPIMTLFQTLKIVWRFFIILGNSILSRSTVFHAMFEHDMEEKKNSAVNVEDVEADAMESMLHFIYTGGWYSSFHFGPLLLDPGTCPNFKAVRS